MSVVFNNDWVKNLCFFFSGDQFWHHIITPLWVTCWVLNTLRPRQNGCHFADGIFRCIFLNENVWILLKISLSFVPKGPINNIPTLVQVMAWRRPGDKPLNEPMMISLLTHICVTRPQWVNSLRLCDRYAWVKYTIIGSYYGLLLVGAKPLSQPMLVYCQLDH